jgi:hypothetical protein
MKGGIIMGDWYNVANAILEYIFASIIVFDIGVIIYDKKKNKINKK